MLLPRPTVSRGYSSEPGSWEAEAVSQLKPTLEADSGLDMKRAKKVVKHGREPRDWLDVSA